MTQVGRSLCLVFVGVAATVIGRESVAKIQSANDPSAQYRGGNNDLVGTWQNVDSRNIILNFGRDGALTILSYSNPKVGRWSAKDNYVNFMTDYFVDCPVGEPPPPKYSFSNSEIRFSPDKNTLKFLNNWDDRYTGSYRRLTTPATVY